MAQRATPSGRSVPASEMRPIAADSTSTVGDFRRYPGCRLVLTCAMCGWAKTYDPERIIDRLRELKVGGHTTRLSDVARRVGWDCPGCHRVRWRAQFGWPPAMTAGEARRLANRYRN